MERVPLTSLRRYQGVAMAAHIADAEGLDPCSIQEAQRRPEWLHWQEVILEEVCTLEAHGTWRLEQPPPGANIVSCCWVFHAKKDAAGNIYRYRACLVAQGFSQVPGVDFFDTYAPVAKMASIQTLLAFAARHNFEVHQVDVKSAYLHGDFEENKVIYMSLPPGVELTKEKGLVLRLLHPLYGLQQSTWHWHKKLLRTLQSCLCMLQCDIDQAIFYRVETDSLIAMGMHINDLTIVTSGDPLMAKVKASLRKDFDILDEGPIHWILRFAVECNRKVRMLLLSQVLYIKLIV